MRSQLPRPRLADRVVLMSLDAFRPEFCRDETWPAPVLQQLAWEGAYADGVRSVFPALTYPAHATIVTGALPARHGIVHNRPFEPGGQTGRWHCEAEALKVPAHRAGCRLAREINEVTIDARADIVIADSHPADRDLWQSAKGLYAGSMAVRDGGSLILVAPNPEGVADHHPIMLQIGYRPFRQLADLIAAREVDDVVGVAVLAHIAQIVDRVDCILVSPGIDR